MSKTRFNRLVENIDQLVKNEGWESEDRDKIKGVLKKLSHALDVKNIKVVRKAIDELSKILLG
ncbi:MAG: hypothetical protein Q7S60_03755 [bacterium]|nr:hypothetical protein [bacterium]